MSTEASEAIAEKGGPNVVGLFAGAHLQLLNQFFLFFNVLFQFFNFFSALLQQFHHFFFSCLLVQYA